MNIYRTIIEDLQRWKESKGRKPLIIQGARQTGKTWIMRNFGIQFFENTAEFNFDKTKELSEIFDRTKDVNRILKELALFSNVPIIPGKTLIIFDEIQECGGALNSLKYFCEDAPGYHIIAAGSLLGVSVRNKKMTVPVGKVEILQMKPVTFLEFLHTSDKRTYNFVQDLSKIDLYRQ